jgi:hypothetical protein
MDPDALFTSIIKKTCSGWEHVTHGLLNLSFMLLDGTGRLAGN